MDGKESVLKMSDQEMNKYDNIISILENSKGENINISTLVFDAIEKEEQPSEALRFFFENADDVETADETEVPEFISKEKYQDLQKKCKNLVDGIIINLVSQDFEEDVFYENLWNAITDNPLLKTKEEKVYAFCQMWMDDRVPYFHLSQGVLMEDEEFGRISLARKREIQKVFHIISMPIQQRTERASLILRAVDECETDAEKAVVLAHALGYTERKALKEIVEKIDSELKDV